MLPAARVLVIVAAIWSAARAEAAPTVTMDVGAKVLEVRAGKQPRATIDKGKRAGLQVGDVGEVYPLRKTEGAKDESVDWNVRLALGRVVEVTDSGATIALEAVGEPVAPGAYFSYTLKVSPELADSPLFRVVALGVELRPQWEDKVYTSVEQLLADPSPAARDRVLDAMIADIKAMKSTVESTLTQRIQDGRFHGKTAGEVVDLLDRAQLADFFVYVEGFPGKFLSHRWKVPEIYFTWVITGTPSGEADRKLRHARSQVSAAKTAAKAGKLDEAYELWQGVLRAVPDHKDAIAAVARIDKIRLLQRTVGEDADDTADRYTLADELFTLGAYDLELKELDALAHHKYDPGKLAKLRAYTLARQDKWRDAEAAFTALVKAKPDDKNLARWRDFARAQARLATAPGDAAAELALAEVLVTSKDWDGALGAYRKVLEAKAASAAQRDAATKGQLKISVQRDLDQHRQWARDEIAKHDLAAGRESVEQALRLADKLGDAKQAGEILEDLAELARQSSEEELALELLKKRAERVPDDRASYSDLAFALLGFDRLDEAEAAAKQSVTRPGSPAYANLILAQIAEARDQLADAEAFAQKSIAADGKYAWPLLVLARADASRDDWEQAIDHAKRAVALKDAWEIRSVHAAVTLGRQAFEGLRADPKSARERLRLVRAFARLGLGKRAADEIGKLPADGTWRGEAWWALATSPFDRLMLRDRLAAARAARPQTAERKRAAAILEARDRLRAKPSDDATRLALAKLYVQSGDYDRALATIAPLVSASSAPAVADLVHDARSALGLGDQQKLGRDALARHDLDGAERIAATLQASYDRIGVPAGRISSRELRSEILAERGMYDAAIPLVEEARQIAAADGAVESESIVARRIGWLRSQTGSNDARRAALDAGKQICDDADEERCLYFIELEIAALAMDDGRAASALDVTRAAWNLADRLADAELARGARFKLADANLTAGRYADADQLALALLADSRKANDIVNEQYSLMVLGAVATARGQGKSARGRFQEVYDLGTRNGQNDWRALARRFEGSSWLEADHDPAKAAAALEQAADLYKTIGAGWAVETRGSALSDLADARLQAGKLGPARDAAVEALAIAQKFGRGPRVASAEWILAQIAVAEHHPDDAVAHAKTAVAGAAKTDDPALVWNAWHALARAHALAGRDREAADAYEKALDALGRALLLAGGDSERAGFMNTGRVREIYKDATALFLKMGNTGRAMEILELSRDAQLKQAFDATKVQTKDPKLRARLDKVEAARAHVNGLQKQLDETHSETRAKALAEEIAKTTQELKQVSLDLKVTHRYLYQALALDPQTLVGRRDTLPAGSVLVEYFVAEDALYAFVIAAALAQPAVVKVNVKASELDEAIADYKDAVLAESETVKHRDRVLALGKKLGDWLLAPLHDHLKGASTVIVIPFGSLYYVPFDALVVSSGDQPLRYAIEDYRISIQTASTLEHLFAPPRPHTAGTMLAISNPDGSLPGAQLEVNRIVKSAMPDAHVLGKTATVQAFRDQAGSFRYLHLATHGILDPDPRKSFMKMADGPLTVAMIAQLQGLDQANEMVVLSACDTAMEIGKSTGDELVSIAVAFSMAGSPSLVASLWAVSDDSTAELMATFYRALQAGTGDRLDALRNAKLNVLRLQRGSETPYAAPWHWAAFQLYGDFRPPEK